MAPIDFKPALIDILTSGRVMRVNELLARVKRAVPTTDPSALEKTVRDLGNQGYLIVHLSDAHPEQFNDSFVAPTPKLFGNLASLRQP